MKRTYPWDTKSAEQSSWPRSPPPDPRHHWVRDAEKEPRYFGDEEHFHQGQRYVGVVDKWFPGKGGFIISDESWKIFEADIYLHARKVEEAGLESVMEDGLKVEFTTMRGPKSVQATDLRLPDERRHYRESRRESESSRPQYRAPWRESNGSKPKYFGDEDHFHKGQWYRGEVCKWNRERFFGLIHSDEAWRVFEAEIFLLGTTVREAGLDDVMDLGLEVEFTTMRGPKSVMVADLRPVRTRRQRHTGRQASDADDEQRHTKVGKESKDWEPRYLGDEDHFHQGKRYTGVVRGWRVGSFGFIDSDETWKMFDSGIILLPAKVDEAGLQDVMEDGLEVEFTTMRGSKGILATDVALAEKGRRRHDRRKASEGSQPRYYGDEDHFHQGQRYTGIVRGWRAGKFGFIHSDETWKIFDSEIFLLPAKVDEAGLQDVMEDGLEVEFTTMRGPKGVQATEICLADDEQDPPEVGKEPTLGEPRYLGDEDHFHQGQRYMGVVREWREGQFGVIHSDEAKKIFGDEIIVLPTKVEEAGLQDMMEDGLEVEFTTMRGSEGVLATDLQRVTW